MGDAAAAAAPSPIIPMPGQENLHLDDLVVGRDIQGFNDGSAATAMFRYNIAAMLRLDDGRVLVADLLNNRIRVLSDNLQQVSTVAGNGEAGHRDGDALQAQFEGPRDLILLDDGRVLVADEHNHCIRMLSANLQEVSTVAGVARTPGFHDGGALQAQFRNPFGLTLLPDGRVLVADFLNHRIRMLSADRSQVSTAAGDGVVYHRDGAAAQAQFCMPADLVSLNDGRVLVADLGNHRIRVLSANLLSVGTVAGDGEEAHRDGAAEQAQFNCPYRLKHLGDGRVLLVDTNGGRRIRILSNDLKQVSTLTKNADTLNSVSALELLEEGRMLVANNGRIYVFTGLVSDFGPKSMGQMTLDTKSAKAGGEQLHPSFRRLRF